MKDNKMLAVVVEPMKAPRIEEIGMQLEDLQALVDGTIQAVYPYRDPVAIICNDEGKLLDLQLNRALRDEDNKPYDIIAGTFAVVGLGEEDFTDLTDELAEKYAAKFQTPEMFLQIGSSISILAAPTEADGDITLTL